MNNEYTETKNRNKNMVIRGYLKERLPVFLLVLGSSVIYGVVFFLYRIAPEAALYGGLLVLCLLIFAGVLDYMAYRKKYLELENLRGNNLLLNGNLPNPNGLLEETYQNLLVELRDLVHGMSDDFSASRQDLVDYYTIWVHQIKTPIAAMRLLLQTEEGLLDTELPTELFKIEQYVEMALHYLRLEEGGSDFLFRQYKLSDIVKLALRKYARIFVRKKLVLDFEEFDVLIVTDEKWLQFVIEQLISNAVKYTKSGTISIYLEGETSKYLVIEDTGMGINPEDLPRIFEKGFTGYNGRQDKKSTGIGLYLCQKVLKKLSMSIQAESVPGKGTRMKVFFNEL